jgi:hypothetical protein
MPEAGDFLELMLLYQYHGKFTNEYDQLPTLYLKAAYVSKCLFIFRQVWLNELRPCLWCKLVFDIFAFFRFTLKSESTLAFKPRTFVLKCGVNQVSSERKFWWMSELTGNDLPHEMSNGLSYDFSEDKNVCLSVRLSVCLTDCLSCFYHG